MALTFQQVRQLFEGKGLSPQEAQQVTYDELIVCSRVMNLYEADPTLDDRQLELCYTSLMGDASIVCDQTGIELQDRAGIPIEHLSNVLYHTPDVQKITITRTDYQIARKKYSSPLASSSSDGGSGCNNNNNNNNNNA